MSNFISFLFQPEGSFKFFDDYGRRRLSYWNQIIIMIVIVSWQRVSETEVDSCSEDQIPRKFFMFSFVSDHCIIGCGGSSVWVCEHAAFLCANASN